MKNGLEKAVFNEIPEILEIKNKMIDDGFNMALMSGSGSSVYCLSKSLKALQNEANKFDNKKFYVKVTSII